MEKNIPTIVFERSLVFSFFKIRVEEMQTSGRCFSVRSFLVVYNVYVVRQTEWWNFKGGKIGGTNLIGREERRSMRLSGTRNMNGFLVRTCLLGITVLKYDLIALLVPWNLAQHSINYGNARFDYIIIILWNLIYFPTFCVFIFIYIFGDITVRIF